MTADTSTSDSAIVIQIYAGGFFNFVLDEIYTATERRDQCD